MFDEMKFDKFKNVKLGVTNGQITADGEAVWRVHCSGCLGFIGYLTSDEFINGAGRQTFGYLCFECEAHVCARCHKVVDVCECAFGPKEHPWTYGDEENFHWEVKRSLVLFSISHQDGGAND